MRRFICCCIATMALSSTGCGKGNSLYPVTGHVTFKGKPAAGATVFFYREGVDSMNEHTIMGIVQEDGSFEVVCGALGNGAPAGEYDVLIEWKHVLGQSEGRLRHGLDRLHGRYANRNHPLLHATVETRATILPPFELEVTGLDGKE
jgi:hypothetical protein